MAKKDSKNRIIAALGIVIILLLVLVIFMFFYFNTGITSSDGNVIVQLG